MGLFSRTREAPVADVPDPPPVESYIGEAGTVTLAEVLAVYDVVETVTDCETPFIIVSAKAGRGSSLDHYDVEPVKGSISYGLGNELAGSVTFHEPTALERARGDKISQQETARELKHLSDIAGYGHPGGFVDLRELGTSSPSPFTSFFRKEYNQDLIGIKGLQIYDKMRRNDGVVRGTLRTIKTPILAARWFIKPCDKSKAADVNAAEFVWKNLTKLMSIGWSQFLTECTLMYDFGYYMFEIVWGEAIVDGQDRIIVEKLTPRHPMDVLFWVYDEHGGPNGVWMADPDGMGDDVYIPISKLLVFTFDREAGDMTGISVLRSAYKHWYFKDQLYKIDAIQKERHGIGVPVIELPPGFTDKDKDLANELGRNIRTNERAHIALPPQWKFIFAKLEGQPVDVLKSIAVHDEAIRENILATFMGAQTHAADDERQQLFLKSTRFAANIVIEVLNLCLVPKMIAANFQRVGNPEICARRIGENEDWRTLSFAVRNLVGCGALLMDDKVEEWLRDEMDMPEIDWETRRYPPVNSQIPIPAEANPNQQDPKQAQIDAYNQDTGKGDKAKAGLPKQRSGPPAPYQQKGNAGGDRSGG